LFVASASSSKRTHVEPLWVRPEYANLIPLALAKEVFEINPKKTCSTVCPYNRPEITVEKVEDILAAFAETFSSTTNRGKRTRAACHPKW
jgi:hypothetical protein